jgi:hypothetical protein
MLYVHLRLQGEVEEHEKIVSALREVDVVISALAYPQVLDQLKIIDAIKVAGNIQVTTLSISLFSRKTHFTYMKFQGFFNLNFEV